MCMHVLLLSLLSLLVFSFTISLYYFNCWCAIHIICIHAPAYILVNVICIEERRALSMHNELPIVVVQSKERVPSPQLTNGLF